MALNYLKLTKWMACLIWPVMLFVLLFTGCKQPAVLYEPEGMPTPPPQSPQEVNEADEPSGEGDDGDVSQLADDNSSEGESDESASSGEAASVDSATQSNQQQSTGKGIEGSSKSSVNSMPISIKMAGAAKVKPMAEALPADLPGEVPPSENEPE